MTVQASDFIKYKNREFTLIDVERNKQLIDCANFIMPDVPKSISSGCWRGYTATYSIESGRLFGIRHKSYWEDDEYKCASSEKLPLNYSGSCVVAIGEEGRWVISDFLECYLDYDEAYEWHFTDGMLDEEINLIDAIEELRKLEETDFYKSEETEPRKRAELREKIARKHLKYSYGMRSYKWRGSGPDPYEDELD